MYTHLHWDIVNSTVKTVDYMGILMIVVTIQYVLVIRLIGSFYGSEQLHTSHFLQEISTNTLLYSTIHSLSCSLFLHIYLTLHQKIKYNHCSTTSLSLL